jgi:O-antigen ligase
MFATFVIVAVVLFLAWKKPIIAIAVLLQTNLVRSIVEINLSDLCFYCTNESNVILGVVLPLAAFFTILIRISYKSAKFKYKLDPFDGFFLLTYAILIIGIFHAPNIMDAADYTFRFILIGSSYYFITKIILLNKPQKLLIIKKFFITSIILGFVLGNLALFLIAYSGQSVIRITLPGVHPIPFSQLIGLAFLISFVIFYSNGKIFNIQNKNYLKINILLFIYFTILLFATNTRGVLFSAIIAVLFFLILNIKKVKKTNLYIYGTILLVVITVIVVNIDVEVLFNRLLKSASDKSISDRIIAYNDSIRLFINYLFGVGTNGFKYHSILGYPHNFFLENLAQYGLLGVILNIYFLLLTLHMFLITISYRKKDMLIVFLFSLFCFFMIETMFSFTLWMHKGMYLSLGLFAGYYYYLKKTSRL